MSPPVDARKFNLQVLLFHADSAEVKDRVVASDILGQCLGNLSKVNGRILPDVFKKNSLKVPITFALLTRCEDVSPTVRTKALTAISSNMKQIIQFFEETRYVKRFQIDGADVTEEDLDVNGTHRFFWYRLRSFKERRNEFEAMLKRRTDDGCAFTRKAALLAFQNLLIFDHNCVDDGNLKYFEIASHDVNLIVRKQVIQCLSYLLTVFPENFVIQKFWLRCVLSLIDDAENPIQAKALSLLEAEFLQNIFSPFGNVNERSLGLLKILSSFEFIPYQKYLKKAFQFWESEDKLKPETGCHLMEYIGTEWEDSIWFYFSCLAPHCPLPPVISHAWIEGFTSFLCVDDKILCMERMLTVAKQMFPHWTSETLENILGTIATNLKSFSIPVELISHCIEALFRMHKFRGTLLDFEEFSFEVLQLCQKVLSDSNSERKIDEPRSEDQMAKCFKTIAELCVFFPSYITPDMISFLLTYLSCSPKPMETSATLKAHVLTTLGKFCIQNEDLAKELFSEFAREYFLSEHDVIRNNSAIILIDLCKLYSSFSCKFMPLMIAFFKDKHYLIRYQTVVLLVHMLCEGYIKWQGSMFYCLLSTLTDKNEAIQEIGQHSLLQLFQGRKRIFSEYFIESIFVLNSFPPPDNMIATQKVKHLQKFALPGETRRGKRMVLYRFLLESTDIKQKVNLIKSICDILKNVAESVYPLNFRTECIIRDCFAILTCPEIRILNVEEFENVESEIEDEVNRTELDIRRMIIVDSIVPTVIGLKNGIRNPKSDLMKDIILFLKDLLYDFRDNQSEILAEDSILLRLLQLEIKKDDLRRKSISKKLQEENILSMADHVGNETNDPVVFAQNSVVTVDFNECSTRAKNFERKRKRSLNMDNVDESVRQLSKGMNKKLRIENEQIDPVVNGLNYPIIISESPVASSEGLLQVVTDKRRCNKGTEMKDDDERFRTMNNSTRERLHEKNLQTKEDLVSIELNYSANILSQNQVGTVDSDECLSVKSVRKCKQRATFVSLSNETEKPLRRSQRLLEKQQAKMVRLE